MRKAYRNEAVLYNIIKGGTARQGIKARHYYCFTYITGKLRP